jgi:prepilin-type N-terminal cleavage/methylation domain-containing protein
MNGIFANVATAHGRQGAQGVHAARFAPRRLRAPVPSPCHARAQSCSAFTLIELMVAIALLVMIMLGINQVFKITGDAVSSGQAVSAMTRDAQAVQTVLAGDFQAMVSGNDAPWLMIRSTVTPTFRNRADQLGDRDGNPRTIDTNNDGTDDLTLALTRTNTRIHRTDVLGFFARDLFRRQTGNDGELTDGFVSREGYIWYGHLAQNDGSGNWRNPGEGTFTSNPYNFYATDWILGRAVMLLAEPGVIGNARNHIRRNNATPPDLSPLRFDSISTRYGSPMPAQFILADHRYDLAGATMGTILEDVQDALSRPVGGTTPNSRNWWAPMVAAMNVSTAATDPKNATGPTLRFRGSTFFSRPLTAEGAARTAPVLMDGATSFIVEFAGDYLEQNPANGNITNHAYSASPSTDGQIDYLIDPVTLERRIRWYGFPRDVTETGTATWDRDVVPLHTVLAASGTAIADPNEPRFERNRRVSPFDADSDYTCVWAPGDRKPRLIRIIITQDEPTAATAAGQTFEYVFELK